MCETMDLSLSVAMVNNVRVCGVEGVVEKAETTVLIYRGGASGLGQLGRGSGDRPRGGRQSLLLAGFIATNHRRAPQLQRARVARCGSSYRR